MKKTFMTASLLLALGACQTTGGLETTSALAEIKTSNDAAMIFNNLHENCLSNKGKSTILVDEDTAQEVRDTDNFIDLAINKFIELSSNDTTKYVATTPIIYGCYLPETAHFYSTTVGGISGVASNPIKIWAKYQMIPHGEKNLEIQGSIVRTTTGRSGQVRHIETRNQKELNEIQEQLNKLFL